MRQRGVQTWAFQDAHVCLVSYTVQLFSLETVSLSQSPPCFQDRCKQHTSFLCGRAHFLCGYTSYPVVWRGTSPLLRQAMSTIPGSCRLPEPCRGNLYVKWKSGFCAQEDNCKRKKIRHDFLLISASLYIFIFVGRAVGVWMDGGQKGGWRTICKTQWVHAFTFISPVIFLFITHWSWKISSLFGLEIGIRVPLAVLRKSSINVRFYLLWSKLFHLMLEIGLTLMLIWRAQTFSYPGKRICHIPGKNILTSLWSWSLGLI